MVGHSEGLKATAIVVFIMLKSETCKFRAIENKLNNTELLIPPKSRHSTSGKQQVHQVNDILKSIYFVDGF